MSEQRELLDLIARLEAASEGSADLDREIEAWLFPQHRTLIFRDKWNPPPRTTSLDAALTLIDHRWRWLLDKRPWGEQRQDGFRAEVYLPAHPYKSDGSDVPSHWGPSPALALCIAALKARAQKG